MRLLRVLLNEEEPSPLAGLVLDYTSSPTCAVCSLEPVSGVTENAPTFRMCTCTFICKKKSVCEFTLQRKPGTSTWINVLNLM